MEIFEKLIASFTNKTKEIDFVKLSEELKNSKDLDWLLSASENELMLLFKLLIEYKQFDLISQILLHKKAHKISNFYLLVYVSLIEADVYSEISQIDLKELNSNLTKEEALFLKPYIDSLQTMDQKSVEQGVLNLKSQYQRHRSEFLDQIEFLENQNLNEKAFEIKQRLGFHFPEEVHPDQVQKEAEQPKKLELSKDLSFSKLIERNLSFESRKKQRLDKNYQKNLNDRQNEDLTFLNSLLSLWKEVFNDSLEIFLIQLEFFPFPLKEMHSELLDEDIEVFDDWTKVELYIKSERFFEGLDYLESIQQKILDNQPQDVYHYYYYKAILFKNIGMLDEAERLFKAIHEQKEDFRDVKYHLSD